MGKPALILLVVLVAVSTLVYATEVDLGAVEIVNGTVVDVDIGSVQYGGMMGTVKLRLGSFEWHPDSVWLVPEGMDPDEFNYSGKTYRVPTDLNLTNNCVSSIYELDGNRAFKATVKSGEFCLLADSGSYRIVAEY